MSIRLLAVLFLGAALSASFAQEAAVPPDAQSNPSGNFAPRGTWGNGMGMGRGVMGTVTEVTADHYTIRTDADETYTVHYSVNTRIMKQGMRRSRGERAGKEDGGQRTPPQMLKPDEIKVGDIIGANGEVDAAHNSIGAVFIVQIDPERAKQMREMEANFGKTWLAGRVTAIQGVSVTLQGGSGNATHVFRADENTEFRRRREPITLVDIQVGDMVRAEGALKDGHFVATGVTVMGRPRGAEGPSQQDPPMPPQ
ncbi:MAG: hypothetical protein KGN79_06435 [Acidobacteriota bacterium]|nr:hypothetical protein [Acidobacteriota bacterium]